MHFGKDGQALTAQALLSRVEAAEAQVLSLKGDGRLGVDGPQGKGTATLFAQVTHPSLVHLEQLDFFGKPQGVLVTDSERFGLYNAQDATYYRGPATHENLAKFLPLVLPVRELVSLLLGRVPRLPAETMALSIDSERRVYVLTLERGEVTQTLLVEPISHRVVKSTVKGVSAYDVEFSDIAQFGVATFPRTLVLRAPSTRTTVEIAWKDIAVNEPPDLTLFEMVAPEDVPVVDLDESARAKPTP